MVLFVSEIISNDVTAIGVMVTLAALEPITGVRPIDAISGFANPATVTIVAMYMLSAGIQRTGLIERLGVELAKLTRGKERRVLAASMGATYPLAGFINNTPIVAIFMPMVINLANRSKISPSKLLMPLSYVAILGGSLTLIGTSTNLIASSLTTTLLDRGPIGFFEFTQLGVIILGIGTLYLLTVGRRLLPARVPPAEDLTEAFALEDHLYQVRVTADSELIGHHLGEIDRDSEIDIIQLDRGSSSFPGTSDLVVESGDRLVLLGKYKAVDEFATANDLTQLSKKSVDQDTFSDQDRGNSLAKLVVAPNSNYIGKPLGEYRLSQRYETSILAINRRSGERIINDLESVVLEVGDTLLVRSNDAALAYIHDRGNFIRVDAPPFDIFERDGDGLPPIDRNAKLAVGIMCAVVGIAALGYLPISIAALFGVFAMVVTGVLTPSDAYNSVSWNIIFLLAGVIPLGIAMQETGGAEMVADVLSASGAFLPLIGVLLLIVVVTGLFANVITPVATVVLMIPVAVDAAAQLGANQFAFLLGVMFASASSFMTPVGYQTNLMVYGPGGYRFTDFLRVGGPLQFLIALVITVGVAMFWGLTP
ncbi:SLC13 family permease [Halorientalis salina]|uniref:SLC13 family permease n=1 Tax=Halorientalis salina TaxID=2932266 RepID=UPI002117F455|nr:SLC13 family permease [Halorientalis salina]